LIVGDLAAVAPKNDARLHFYSLEGGQNCAPAKVRPASRRSACRIFGD
jgi:hypothetical protein